MKQEKLQITAAFLQICRNANSWKTNLKKALHDSLTEVCNRFAYIERMNALLEVTENKVMPIQHAVLFMDLDRFKQVNDLLGHAIGDQ